MSFKNKLLGFGVSLLALAAVGLSQASSVSAAQPGQVGSAPRCTVTAIGARSSAFTVNGASARVSFKVTGSSNCKVRVSANSFYAPTMTGRPYDKQILFDRTTRIYTPGKYTQSVAMPVKSNKTKGCYYQVDLTYGTHNVTPVLAYGHGKLQCGNPPVPQSHPGVTIFKYVDTNKKYQRVGINIEYTYRVVVRNIGDTNLTNVVLTDTPDQGITLLSVSPQAGTLKPNGWTYTMPQLPKGTELTFTFTAKVPVYLAGKLTNTVCVDAPQVPGNPDKCDKATVDVPPKPGMIEVCVLADKTIKAIAETDFDPSKHSKDPNDCKEEPTTPTELPETGPIDTLMQAIGAMSLSSAGAYYAMSRRQI